jgi:hypothetical protein
VTPVLLQDEDRRLFSWFASKPDARRLVRERCLEIKKGRCMGNILTPEQIDKAYRDVWSTVAHQHRLSAFAEAIAAEVRKQDTELIGKMQGALSIAISNLAWLELSESDRANINSALFAIRARMGQQP